ncbi:MAG: hypothetical protein ACKOCC_07750 [Actinomycetota bacterium]
MTVTWDEAFAMAVKFAYPVGFVRINQPPFGICVPTVKENVTEVVAPTAGFPSVAMPDKATARTPAKGHTRVVANSATMIGAQG